MADDLFPPTGDGDAGNPLSPRWDAVVELLFRCPADHPARAVVRQCVPFTGWKEKDHVSYLETLEALLADNPPPERTLGA
jgi:hypothetical protein